MEHELIVRDHLKKFMERCEETLRRNDHKEGWGDMTLLEHLDRLEGEVGELRKVIKSKNPQILSVINECTDVANYASFISELCEEAFNLAIVPPHVIRRD